VAETLNILTAVLIGVILVAAGFTHADISPIIWASLSILLLALAAFDSVIELKLHRLDSSALRALRTVLIGVGLSILAALGFTLMQPAISTASLLILVLLATKTTAAVTGKGRLKEALRLESLFASPLALILPLTIMTLRSIPSTSADFLTVFTRLGLNYVTGIAVGVVIGWIVLKLFHRWQTITLVAGTLVAYLVADALGGNAVLAIFALGLFLANATAKQLVTREHALLDVVTVIAALALGLTAMIPLTPALWGIAFSVVVIAFFVRFVALSGQRLSPRDHLYLALSSPKGLPTLTALVAIAPPETAGIGLVVVVVQYALAQCADWFL
jgi:hypothetical protein